ncbi:hypothetical protein F5Y14DRAFT_412738 [Nemania sp. NC0429]|nr:hypothetical protein F5Y14DRAFT_412738 [Nemania sp. NC0429]
MISSSLSEPVSDTSEHFNWNGPLGIGFRTCGHLGAGSMEPGGIDQFSGLPVDSFAFGQDPKLDFDEPRVVGTSSFSMDQIDQCEHGSQPPASNANNHEGGPLNAPFIAISTDLPTGEFHEKQPTERELRRLSMDYKNPPLRESTEGSSSSNSTPRSTDESTASSDYEDDIEFDDSDSILKPLTEPLLKNLLSAYSRSILSKNCGEVEASESNHGGVPDSTTPVATGEQTVAGCQFERSSNPTKRKRQAMAQNNSGDGEDEDEEEELPPRKRVVPLKEVALLACPFAKWKPLSYQSCHKYIMKDIGRVKQHLHRFHIRPVYCARCGETFKDEDALHSHQRSISCPVGPKRALEGVTSTQEKQLERRVDRKLSKSDQWYSIFSILFPDSPRPSSAYLENDISAEMLRLQKFFATDGLKIVEHTVHNYIPSRFRPHREEFLSFTQFVLQRLMTESLKNYDATRQHNSSPESGYESLNHPNSSQSTPVGQKVDEGTRVEPNFEINDPTLKDFSLVDGHTLSYVADGLGFPGYNDSNFQEDVMGMDGFQFLDGTWDEDVLWDNDIVDRVTEGAEQ